MPREPRILAEKVYPDRWLVVATLALVALGTVMVFSASAPLALENFGRPDFFLRRQVIRVVAGLVAMWAAMRLDYTILQRRPAQLGLLVATVLLVLLHVPGLGLSGGPHRGSVRSVEVGLFGFQPAEIARLALVVYLADALTRKRELLGDLKRGFLPPVLIVGGLSILVLKQPSMGGAVAILALGFGMLFLAGARWRHLAACAAALVPVALYEILRAPYRWERVRGFLHPERDPTGDGWQIFQSMVALATGGLHGMGIGHSRTRVLYLPDAHTDFILSIVGEELGFLGICLVMALFLLFLGRGFYVAARARDRFGFLLAAGLTASVGINWAINVAVVAHLIPVTGLPLPFVSFGGSSLFIHLIGVGLLLSVSRSRRLRPLDAPAGRVRHVPA